MWVQKVNIIGKFKAVSDSGLCSTHFSPDCYLPSKRLKKDALPSIAPNLVAEDALKLGMIYEVEEFPQFVARHGVNRPVLQELSTEGANVPPTTATNHNLCPRHLDDGPKNPSFPLDGSGGSDVLCSENIMTQCPVPSTSTTGISINTLSEWNQASIKHQGLNPNVTAGSINSYISLEGSEVLTESSVQSTDVTASSTDLQTSFDESQEESVLFQTPHHGRPKRYVGDFSPGDFKYSHPV